LTVLGVEVDDVRLDAASAVLAEHAINTAKYRVPKPRRVTAFMKPPRCSGAFRPWIGRVAKLL
jgi:hypothetical protein